MTSATRLESRPEELWRRIGPLHERFTEGKRLAAVHAEALAEAYFRIGVHPGTTPASAVEVLGHAHRLDPANPKHPYHLGLLYLRRGQPEQAVVWLKAAAARSPVNHRVRAHLSIAFRDLDALRQDTAGYTGADRALGAEIAVAVRTGVDEFETAPGDEDRDGSVSVALIQPGVCRWSGIHDVEAEVRLRGRTTERTRDALAADLETVVELASRRAGGTAAFTVLAVQWMVSGYPVATIRRLARRLPPGDGPSAGLLELVCELFETDPAELPSRLAACLAQGSLPDLLAALIHHRRLLWRPLRFPDLGAHAAAREAAEEEPDRHVKALDAARRELGADRPAPMADVTEQAADPDARATDPDARLAALEQAAQGLKELRGDLQRQIKALVPQKIDTENDYARVAGDRRLLKDLIDGLEQARTLWLADLQQFKEAEPAGLVMDFGEFQRRLENCEADLQDSFRSLEAPLKKRVDKQLDKARPAYGEIEPRPSQRAQELAGRCADLERPQQPTTSAGEDQTPSGPTPPDRSLPPTPPPQPPAPATARERVAGALAAAEQALDANFAEAWQTLEAYPSALRHGDGLVLLRGHLAGRQAEAEFRLGRSASARRRWIALLADDPLDPGVLHNLAVAHTSAGDPADAAEAWGRYVEAIYLRDLLHGEVRRGAAERASLHRVLAASFGTAPLCVALIPGEERMEVAQQIPLLLSSRAKVTLVTEHLRLDELNHATSHRSPILLLGIDRSDGDGAPAARERRAEALRAAVRLLPARVRDAFEKECLRLLDEACAAASEAKGRVRRPGDEAEETAHKRWARGRIEWKVGILEAVNGKDADWPLTEYSGAVIANLRLVDELSLDSTDPLLADCVQQAFPGDDPGAVIQMLDDLTGCAAGFALKRILAAADGAADAEGGTRRFAERFRRIGRSWGRNPVPEHSLEALDDPVTLYGASVKQALLIIGRSETPADDDEREILTSAVPVLRDWTARLPGATGPARALARLLGALGDYDEALSTLTRADTEAFSALGREKVLRARALLDILRGEFQAAVTFLRSHLADHPDDEHLRGLLTTAFDRWIKSGGPLPAPEAITEAFARWTDEETVRDRRILALNAALAAFGGRAAAGGVEPLVQTLRAMVAADPGHVDAHYHLSVALHRLAYECREQMSKVARAPREERRTAMMAALTECRERSQALLPRLAGDEYATHHAELERILAEVDEALGS